ncbi:hypothetical protein FRX31_025135 [Thalictrum thalictroides]|uniref:Uncharacterized protein n=1 Tax=Thalictrum thalictroides TaxID=46969 RepID=A0A7J6VKI3_THATH|nr:hypothetical protein FRX31_025135 [Thalictrum thalictroides]
MKSNKGSAQLTFQLDYLPLPELPNDTSIHSYTGISLAISNTITGTVAVVISLTHHFREQQSGLPRTSLSLEQRSSRSIGMLLNNSVTLTLQIHRVALLYTRNIPN